MSYWSWFLRHQFFSELQYPQKRQDRLLKKIITQLSDTQYGLLFNICQQDTYAEFAKKIPVITYEKLRHWIERQKKLETNILVNEPVTHYVIFQDSRLIPYTKSLEKSFRRLYAIQETTTSDYLEAPLFVKIPQSDYLLPLLSEVFFEFTDQHKKIFRLHELELGIEYDVMISQKSGLYRYQTGLHVLACDLCKKTPRFQVLHDSYSDLRQALFRSY